MWARASTLALSGALAVAAALTLVLTPLHANVEASGHPPRESIRGRDRHEAACAACHGRDGRGAPQALLGFDVAVPDFTDCSFVTSCRTKS